MTNERADDLAGQTEEAEIGFVRTWCMLAGQGECDAVGGAESFRVFRAWLAAGRPTRVARFILELANRPASADAGARPAAL
jgi:hypothetical protein